MRLTKEQVAEVKACQWVYSLRDTADHYNVSKTTVYNIWEGNAHKTVRPALEPPNMRATAFPMAWLRTDILILKARGLTAREIAEELDISVKTVQRYGGCEA